MAIERIISADDHLQEPADLWQARLPAALRDRAPKLVTLPDGGQGWQVADQPPRPLGILVMAGRRPEEFQDSGLTWDDVRPGCYDPHERIYDMDVDGIHASVLYPNVCLDFFMAQVALDPEVAGPCYQVYNDHLADFCSTNPDRLIGIALLPLDTVEGAVAELERIAGVPGLRGALLPIIPPGDADWNDPKFEPLWAAASETGLPLSIHAGRPRGMAPRHQIMQMNAGAAIYMHIGPFSTAEALAHIMWTGVFDRYPTLRIVSVEGGIGWLPFFKERAQRVFDRHRAWMGAKVESGPEAWFGRNLFATFEQDEAGIHSRDLIGVDTLVWASDYPHSETSWPNSKQSIETTFRNVPQDQVQKIVHDNAARLYGIR
ncbi:MAG: amidohydrolase family protein [Dehalococcoidia bacterium]